MMDIVTWAESKFGFYVDRHFDGRRWRHTKAPIKLADYHARMLNHCFTVRGDGTLPYDTVLWCEGAKSGKSAIAALVHEYFALHIEPPSEQYVISNKRDQARSKVFKSICQSVEWNPHIRRDPNKYDLTFANGTVVGAIPCNYRGEAGARYTLASFDEPWAIMYSDGVRLVSEFKTDPTRTVSCRLFTGYAGFTGESDLWADMLQSGRDGKPVPELIGIDDGRGDPACWHNGRLFSFWSHTARQPWQTKEWLASLEATLTPGEFARMVHCDFAASEESFIQEAWWRACYDATLPPLRPGDDTPLVLGVDASVSGDCSALVGVSKSDGRVAVRFVRIWEPDKQPGNVIDQSQTIEPAIRWLCENLNVVCCTFDVYQLAKLTQDLRREGLAWFHEFPQGDGSKQNPGRTIADARLRQMILQRQIVYGPRNEGLTQHILNAAAKVRGESKLRLVKKGKASIDAAVSLSMAVATAIRLNLD